VKHHLHAFIFFSKQLSPAIALAAQGHLTGGTAVNAHFFFYPAADYVVGLTQAAVFVHPNFGYQKKGDAPGSLRCAFDPRQNRMNNVFRQVMVTGGNEYFIAG
jgi:hypothetical protein